MHAKNLSIRGPSSGKIKEIDDGGDYAIVHNGEYIIGEAYHHVAEGVTMNSRSNALLWSAAPELLEALEPFTVLARAMEPGQFLMLKGIHISYEQAMAALKAYNKAVG
jgi:hypothetical protein